MRVVLSQSFRHVDDGVDVILEEGAEVEGAAAEIALRLGWGKAVSRPPEVKAVSAAPRNKASRE